MPKHGPEELEEGYESIDRDADRSPYVSVTLCINIKYGYLII